MKKIHLSALLLGGLAGLLILSAGLAVFALKKTAPVVSPPKLTKAITPVKTPFVKTSILVAPAISSLPATKSAAVTNNPVRNNGGPFVPILMYHYVGNNPNPTDRQRDILSITPDKLTAQLDYLTQNQFTPISLDTLYAIYEHKTTAPSKPIVLTFDDGYIDFFINAYPILSAHHMHAVSFIPTGLIGTSYYMSWDQIKQIAASGLVDFEDHTITHPNLTTLSYPEILRQFTDSKKALEAAVGRPVNFVAYPFGASNSTVWKAALDAGFVGGVGTWYAKAGGPGINMPRIRIVGTASMADFASNVNR